MQFGEYCIFLTFKRSDCIISLQQIINMNIYFEMSLTQIPPTHTHTLS